MGNPQSVELPPELAEAVSTAAAWRGMSVDRYVLEVVTRATTLNAELAAAIQQGEDDIAAGRFYTQEQVEAMFEVRREQRNAA